MWFLINSVVLNWQVNYCDVKTYDSLDIALNTYVYQLFDGWHFFRENFDENPVSNNWD